MSPVRMPMPLAPLLGEPRLGPAVHERPRASKPASAPSEMFRAIDHSGMTPSRARSPATKARRAPATAPPPERGEVEPRQRLGSARARRVRRGPRSRPAGRAAASARRDGRRPPAARRAGALARRSPRRDVAHRLDEAARVKPAARAVRHDAPVAHHDDAVGDGQDLVQDVAR